MKVPDKIYITETHHGWYETNEGGDKIEYIRKDALEEDEKNAFCKENCKGFQETGKCFADGECEAKREADKRSDKVLTNDEVKTIIDIYDKHCCECGFGLWDRMKHKDAIAKEVCKRFNNFGKNSK